MDGVDCHQTAWMGWTVIRLHAAGIQGQGHTNIQIYKYTFDERPLSMGREENFCVLLVAPAVQEMVDIPHIPWGPQI